MLNRAGSLGGDVLIAGMVVTPTCDGICSVMIVDGQITVSEDRT